MPLHSAFTVDASVLREGLPQGTAFAGDDAWWGLALAAAAGCVGSTEGLRLRLLDPARKVAVSAELGGHGRASALSVTVSAGLGGLGVPAVNSATMRSMLCAPVNVPTARSGACSTAGASR
jgi:hypothetical protein